MNIDIRKFLSTAVKIVLVCLVVGFILDTVKIDPLGFVRLLSNTLHDVADLAGSAVRWATPYIVLGAFVVVPFYLIKFGLDLLKKKRQR